MRTRLSAEYSIGFKILNAFLLFVVSFILLTNLPHDPWPVWFTFSLDAILLTGSYLMVQFFLKDRVVISFDENSLYLTNVITNSEQIIPLEQVTWLNMRMNIIKTGGIWYTRYSLHYNDMNNPDQKIKFYNKSTDNSLYSFVKAAKAKNPDFRYKNWSWTLDLKD
jgi:hypothetical protein